MDFQSSVMHSSIVENWSRKGPLVPWVTFMVIGICILLFFMSMFFEPQNRSLMMFRLGFVPATIYELIIGGWRQWFDETSLSLMSSMFLHIGWLHLFGNMAYLLVFGVATERWLGHLAYALVFLLGGAMTNVIVALGIHEVATPVIGASGGVSVIVGTYLGLFPQRRIGMYLPLGLYLQFARVPAVLVIGSWFALQLLYTVFSPVNTKLAWWTHVTGFTIGIIAAILARVVKMYRIKKT
jgi:membrane associated rhomboid family serine protease